MQQVNGLEPIASAWKADILPVKLYLHRYTIKARLGRHARMQLQTDRSGRQSDAVYYEASFVLVVSNSADHRTQESSDS